LRRLLPTLLVLIAFISGGVLTWSLVSVGVVASPAPSSAQQQGQDHSHGDSGAGPEEFGQYLRLPKLPRILPRHTSRTSNLNREGVNLLPGVDDAAHNRSSIVRGAGLSHAEVPAFTGSQRTWSRIVTCLKGKFKPFGVVVTDRRPIDKDNYIMAAFGGTARVLGRSRKSAKHTGGLAPFNSESIPGAVVFIFSSTLRNHVTRICETAGMEIAHAYGLDHGYHCKDLMTYKPRCGTRRFVDKTVRCGEEKPRDCANGQRTQNSFQHLLKTLGPASPVTKKKASKVSGARKAAHQH